VTAYDLELSFKLVLASDMVFHPNIRLYVYCLSTVRMYVTPTYKDIQITSVQLDNLQQVIEACLALSA